MLTCDEQHHYRVDGRRIPGVHEVIGAGGFIDTRWYTDEGRYKGNYVDQGCYLLTQGKLDWSSVRPSFRGHLEGFQRFLGETGFRVIEAKQAGHHPDWAFAGEWDLYGQFPHKSLPDIGDVKATASSEGWWRYQTAAYAEIKKAETGKRPGRFALKLVGDGRYTIERHESRNDLRVFLACLTIRNERGLDK